jgi:hypothetical protein
MRDVSKIREWWHEAGVAKCLTNPQQLHGG